MPAALPVKTSAGTLGSRPSARPAPGRSSGRPANGPPQNARAASRPTKSVPQAIASNSLARLAAPDASKALQVRPGRGPNSQLQSQTAPTRSVVAQGGLNFGKTSEERPMHGLFLMNKDQYQNVQQSGTARYNADIVFIHGLFGHPYNSFASKNGDIWAKDFIPEDMPGSRVFSFGYDAGKFTSGTGRPKEFARSLLGQLKAMRRHDQDPNRPIIFVCHSMGGIVAKQALITAKLDDADFGQLRKCVRGMVFMGTPHRGSEIAKLGEILGRMLNIVMARLGNQARTDLIKYLQRDSRELLDVIIESRNQLQDIKILSCVEQKPVVPGQPRIVDEHSAIMGVGQESIMYMQDSNHIDMCRFDSREDNDYVSILASLEDMATLPGAPRVAANHIRALEFPTSTRQAIEVYRH